MQSIKLMLAICLLLTLSACGGGSGSDPSGADASSDSDSGSDSGSGTNAVDTDNDGTPDTEDGDDDNDSIVDGSDNCPLLSNSDQLDIDNDGQLVTDSVENLPQNHAAYIEASCLDAKLYASGATPILVYCDWKKPLTPDGMVRQSLAIPLMLEKELPNWKWASCAETWETMRPYFLGCPHGSRSSLFVDQNTGQAMKSIWNKLINTGMYGPIQVG